MSPEGIDKLITILRRSRAEIDELKREMRAMQMFVLRLISERPDADTDPMFIAATAHLCNDSGSDDKCKTVLASFLAERLPKGTPA